MGVGTQEIYKLVRDQFPYHADDMQWRIELESFYKMLIQGSDLKDKIISILD